MKKVRKESSCGAEPPAPRRAKLYGLEFRRFLAEGEALDLIWQGRTELDAEIAVATGAAL